MNRNGRRTSSREEEEEEERMGIWLRWFDYGEGRRDASATVWYKIKPSDLSPIAMKSGRNHIAPCRVSQFPDPNSTTVALGSNLYAFGGGGIHETAEVVLVEDMNKTIRDDIFIYNDRKGKESWEKYPTVMRSRRCRPTAIPIGDLIYIFGSLSYINHDHEPPFHQIPWAETFNTNTGVSSSIPDPLHVKPDMTFSPLALSHSYQNKIFLLLSPPYPKPYTVLCLDLTYHTWSDGGHLLTPHPFFLYSLLSYTKNAVLDGVLFTCHLDNKVYAYDFYSRTWFPHHVHGFDNLFSLHTYTEDDDYMAPDYCGFIHTLGNGRLFVAFLNPVSHVDCAIFTPIFDRDHHGVRRVSAQVEYYGTFCFRFERCRLLDSFTM